ncbi:hypothetical protein [Actinophytocola sp. KF-1]
MDRRLYDRQVRRADGRNRVAAVTSIVTVGATAVAILLGFVFANGTPQATTVEGTTGSNGSDSYSGTQPGTDSDSDGGWQAPGLVPGDSGPAHGSSGGS